MISDAIPVTLLTGFLGAGKTTLLNCLLKDPKAGKVAVVVNEFGDAGLDHDLIEPSAEDVVLMPGGCVCCSIRGDLSKTLLSLLARRARDELHFDRVVIETTGLADPGPIHHTLLVDPVLAPNFALDGTVTVVDAVHGAATLDRHLEAQAQIAMADRIVVSKSDLVDTPKLAALQTRLDRLNPSVVRLIADHGKVADGALWGLGAMRKPMDQDHALAWLAAPADHPLRGISGLPQQKPTQIPVVSHHATDGRIETASITVAHPIAPSVFDFWLDSLIALRGPNILRLKGIAHIEGAPHPFVFHGVQHIFEPPVPLKNWEDGETISRVVIIARDMTKSDLEQSLSLLRQTELLQADAAEGFAGATVHQMDETPF